MMYERKLQKDLNKTIAHIEHRTAFLLNPNPILVTLLVHAKNIQENIPGCNSDRNKRLSVQKQIEILRVLSIKYGAKE